MLHSEILSVFNGMNVESCKYPLFAQIIHIHGIRFERPQVVAPQV